MVCGIQAAFPKTFLKIKGQCPSNSNNQHVLTSYSALHTVLGAYTEWPPNTCKFMLEK